MDDKRMILTFVFAFVLLLNVVTFSLGDNVNEITNYTKVSCDFEDPCHWLNVDDPEVNMKWESTSNWGNDYKFIDMEGKSLGQKARMSTPWLSSLPLPSPPPFNQTTCRLEFIFYIGTDDNCKLSLLLEEPTTTTTMTATTAKENRTVLWSSSKKLKEDAWFSSPQQVDIPCHQLSRFRMSFEGEKLTDKPCGVSTFFNPDNDRLKLDDIRWTWPEDDHQTTAGPMGDEEEDEWSGDLDSDDWFGADDEVSKNETIVDKSNVDGKGVDVDSNANGEEIDLSTDVDDDVSLDSDRDFDFKGENKDKVGPVVDSGHGGDDDVSNNDGDDDVINENGEASNNNGDVSNNNDADVSNNNDGDDVDDNDDDIIISRSGADNIDNSESPKEKTDKGKKEEAEDMDTKLSVATSTKTTTTRATTTTMKTRPTTTKSSDVLFTEFATQPTAGVEGKPDSEMIMFIGIVVAASVGAALVIIVVIVVVVVCRRRKRTRSEPSKKGSRPHRPNGDMISAVSLSKGDIYVITDPEHQNGHSKHYRPTNHLPPLHISDHPPPPPLLGQQPSPVPPVIAGGTCAQNRTRHLTTSFSDDDYKSDVIANGHV